MIKELPRYAGKIEKYAVFVDASKKRFGAALYGIVKDKYMILSAKSGVIPKKKQLIDESIPNNELNAAVLGATLVEEYKFEVSNKTVQYFSDNKAVLQYLKNTTIPVDDYKRRRIQSILKLSNPQNWNYVKSEDNPADMLTKYPSKDQLENWFSRSEIQAKIMAMNLPWNAEENVLSQDKINEKIKLEQQQLNISKLKQRLTLKQSEDGIWKVILRRVEGVNNEETLLSNKMNIAETIGEQIHRKAHIGVDSIRTQLRKNYYIIGETELAKHIYRNCSQCKEFNHLNKFEYKANDPHPSQVQRALYKVIGLDHTGAQVTKEGVKVYILIIICLYSQHMTLKVMNSLEANEVELALVQIKPQKIATNFKFAKETMTISNKWRKQLKIIRDWHNRMLQTIMRQKRKGNEGQQS